MSFTSDELNLIREALRMAAVHYAAEARSKKGNWVFHIKMAEKMNLLYGKLRNIRET